MKDEAIILKKRNIWILYGILMGFMLVGTFFDFQIDKIVQSSHNPIGQFIAFYGLYPIVPCMFVSFVIILKLWITDLKDYICCPLLIINGFMCYEAVSQFYKLFRNVSQTQKFLYSAPGMIFAIVLAIFVFVKVDLKDRKKAKKIAAVILLTGALQFILINKVIKNPWGRPRFRSILAVEGVSFTPWYKPGLSQAAKSLLAAGSIAADEFKSFPSGHAGCGAMFLTLVYLPKIMPMWSKQEKLFTCLGIFWIVLTMLGRMIAGAHFLTDVTMATIITWTLFVVLAKILKPLK